jgi:hypothetical protein
MAPTRREFIKALGVALAAALVRGCGPTCYTPAPNYTPRPSPTPNPAWDAIQECWYALDNLAQSPGDETAATALRQKHAEAVHHLVLWGQLDGNVADRMSLAYEAAVTAAISEAGLAMCYDMVPSFATSNQPLCEHTLLRQVEILEEMAVQGGVNRDTVAQAREAIERDMAWLAQLQADSVSISGSVEIDPASAEAARILVELLLGGGL